MATVTERGSYTRRAEADQRVTHPLAQLRSTIRLYVGLEGGAAFVLFLALWFWIGLAIDYGFFKLFTLDWVQELPRWVRLVVLCGCGAGLLAVLVLKVFLRLFREFRDAALALVLERRFPKLLGDRLITAVELADPKIARECGYSRPMIEQTIRDAAERVDQLSIHDVFDWNRLQRRGKSLGVLTAGVYLAVLLAACIIGGSANVLAQVRNFNDVAAIWFERNILLYDTIWPRRAHLELLDFPGEEIRIGRDATPPTLRVRALKWVIADSNRERAPEGWRALMWTDLTEDLLGSAVPRDALPGGWADWSIDQIEMQPEKPEVVGDVLARLEERAASSKMSRRLRKLTIPASVVVFYKGATTKNEQTLPPGQNHEYSGTVANLKESLRFTIQGEDYYTPYKRIIVVPPPSIIELTVDEAQPAYLYHLIPADGTSADLKGKKQIFTNRPISLTGEKSSIQVPAGTDLVVHARTDKPLKIPGGVRLTPFKGNVEINAPLEQIDEHTFRVIFNHVMTASDFYLEFTDTDNVVGKRRLEIKPIHDTVPEVDVVVEVIRKVNQGYMVTAQARVPFSGKVRDNRGLAAVEYIYTYELEESRADAATRISLAASVASLTVSGFPANTAAVAPAILMSRPAPTNEAGKEPTRVSLATFDKLYKEQALKAVSVNKLQELLEQPPTGSILHEFELDPETEYFDVVRMGLAVSDEKAKQPHYRMRLWVEATDNNVETRPGKGVSKEKFTFLIVDENDLLAEIAKEEEGLHVKLEEAVNRLKDSKIKLDKVIVELPELKKGEFSPMVRRAEEIEEAISKSWDTSREVYGDYKRILRELECNRVKKGMIDKVRFKICEPLDTAIGGEFVRTDEAMRAMHQKLENSVADMPAAETARKEILSLIARLEEVLAGMGDLTNLNKLILALQQIEKREREEYDRLKKLLKEKEDEILGGTGTPEKGKE